MDESVGSDAFDGVWNVYPAPLFDCIIENNVLDVALKEAYDNVSKFLN
jgi:hypothetical protein